MRYRHAYCNVLLSSIFQKEGINLYPNITWSRKDSYVYSFPNELSNSVVAINSKGANCCMRQLITCRLWHMNM